MDRACSILRRRDRVARWLALALLPLLAACSGQGGLDIGEEAYTPPPAATVSPEQLMRLGAATRSAGDLATAARLYAQAHAASPERIEPLLELGATLAAAGAPAPAADAYRAALALRDDARAHNGLGVALDLQGQHPAAEAEYRRALELKPGDRQIVNNLALSLALAGRPDEAIALLEPLAREPAAPARLRQNLALAYGLAGRTDAARRTGRLDLDAAAVERNLGYYETLRALGGDAEWPLGAHLGDDS